MTRRGVLGRIGAAVASAWLVSVRPALARSARRWTNTRCRPLHRHQQLARIAYFSGEAFDQREPILRAVEATLRELAQEVGDRDVWRLGVVTVRIRTGAQADGVMHGISDNEGPRPLDVTFQTAHEHAQVYVCPRCGLVDEDGHIYISEGSTTPRP